MGVLFEQHSDTMATGFWAPWKNKSSDNGILMITGFYNPWPKEDGDRIVRFFTSDKGMDAPETIMDYYNKNGWSKNDMDAQKSPSGLESKCYSKTCGSTNNTENFPPMSQCQNPEAIKETFNRTGWSENINEGLDLECKSLICDETGKR